MMSMLDQSGEEQVECPLCMEPLEVDDLNFFPCTCGYQICRFCWHRIRTDENGLCPACRKAYTENPADFKPLTQEEVAKLKAEKRHKNQQRKQKITENRKHLGNVRVVQRNLVFVVGLPIRLADPEVLKKHEYFGKFGKIHKVVINQSTSYAGSQGPSASAYVTYYRADDALRAIQAVNNIVVDGRTVKTSLGTTKYCSHFMKNQTCPKPDCMYLHDLGDLEASFTKEEMQQGKHQEYERKLHEQLLNNYNQGSKERKPIPSPPSVALHPMNCLTISTSSKCSVLASNANGVLNNQSCNKDAWPSLRPGGAVPGTKSGSSTSTCSIASNSSNSSSTSSNVGSGNGSENDSHISNSGNIQHKNTKVERRHKLEQSVFSAPSKTNGQCYKKRHGLEDFKGKGKEKLHMGCQDERSDKNVHCKSISYIKNRVNTKSRKEVNNDVQKVPNSTRYPDKTNCEMNIILRETQGLKSEVNNESRKTYSELTINVSGDESESTSLTSSLGGNTSANHLPATLFEADNNSFFSTNNFTKLSTSAAGSAGSDWPLSSLTLTHMPDVLPPVHSSEDWQAAFGFSNSAATVPMNQMESTNSEVESENASISSELCRKDDEKCDAHAYNSQGRHDLPVVEFNSSSNVPLSAESTPLSEVQTLEECRLTDVNKVSHKLNKLLLQENVRNSDAKETLVETISGCEMSADDVTLHISASCENTNVIPSTESHVYHSMPSPAFINDPPFLVVNGHPCVQSSSHVIPSGIQPVQAAKFFSEIHVRQLSDTQISHVLPVNLCNRPIMEDTTFSRHLLEENENVAFLLNNNSFGSSSEETNLLPIVKSRRGTSRLTSSKSAESKECLSVSDSEQCSNFDTSVSSVCCESSEFVCSEENEISVHDCIGGSSRETPRVTDDDLGFDPFHETQKALAEMMEKENMMLMLHSQQSHVSYPNSHVNRLNDIHQYQNMSHITHQPAQFSQTAVLGGAKILSSCHSPLQPHFLQNNHRSQANVATISMYSRIDGMALGPGSGLGSVPPRARLPPPGFTTAPNHMNAFGLGIPRTPSNAGSKILPFMGLGNSSGSSNSGSSSPVPPNFNSVSSSISIASTLNAQQPINDVNPPILLFPHSVNNPSTITQLNSTFNTQNGTVAHNSVVSKTATNCFNVKEWPDSLRSLLPIISNGVASSQSPLTVAFSGSNNPTSLPVPPQPSPPTSPPPLSTSSQNSLYIGPTHSPQTNTVQN